MEGELLPKIDSIGTDSKNLDPQEQDFPDELSLSPCDRDSEKFIDSSTNIDDYQDDDKDEEEELSNKWVWYAHETLIWSKALVLSQILGSKQKEYLLSVTETPGIMKRITSDLIHPVDPSHLLDLNNLCMMNDMHEAPLLDLLRRRFTENHIYTYTGDVIISINPYQIIDGLYSDPKAHFSGLINLSLQNFETKEEKPPHVYQIANMALQYLTNPSVSLVSDHLGNRNQSIIISGESGAGKTENSKHVLNFLIEANNYYSSHNNSGKSINLPQDNKNFAQHLNDILVQSSVILEAFGNAKTVRNDNSSRFGKYIKLIYDFEDKKSSSEPILVSAITETFLLEKSRLAYIGKGERSYHIFYQLLSGLTDLEIKNKYNLNHSIDSFKMLVQGGVSFHSEDIFEFQNSLKALEILNCSKEEIDEIWKLLATILHLSNLTFEDSNDRPDYQGDTVVLKCPTCSLEQIANNLGLPLISLNVALTTQQLLVANRSSLKIKILTKSEVSNNVLALLKWLYSKLFDWLVKKINFCHQSVTHFKVDNQSNFIGILDIFGFEILGVNSFEQLCINFTNERLQQQFNEHVFITEQVMYKNEGLEWSDITFRDNQAVIDLISSTKKPSLGLLILLEEQGLLNRKPDDIALLNSFNLIHDKSTSTEKTVRDQAIYSKSRFGKECFIIKHFAGDVTYTVDGFLAKNNDSIQEDLIKLLHSTENSFLINVMGFNPSNLAVDPQLQPGYIPSQIFVSQPVPLTEVKVNQSGGKKMASAASVSLNFRTQLDTLMNTLRSTTPHYIKCIKPNGLKTPNLFDSGLVIQQLRYSGVLEVVRIRREGFPIRMSFPEFVQKYQILLSYHDKHTNNLEKLSFDIAKELSSTVAKASINADLYQIGHTMIFLRQNGLNAMQDAVDRYYSSRIVIIQAKYRSLLAQRHYFYLKCLIICVQSYIRMFLNRFHFSRQKHAINTIKYFYISKRLRRMFIQRYQQIVAERRDKASILIQKYYRGSIQKKKYQIIIQRLRALRLKSAIVIQCTFRSHSSKKLFWKLKTSHSATLIQTNFRRFKSTRSYLLMQSAAIACQTIFRMYYCSKIFHHKYYQVLIMQSLIRRYLARRSCEKKIRAILTIQSFYRVLIAKHKYTLKIALIICLQSWIRMLFAKQKFIHKQICIIMIQAQIRKVLDKKRYLSIRTKIIKIQSCIRTSFAVYNYNLKYCAILAIQSIARMYIQYRNYINIQVSCILIQTHTRKLLCRKRFLSIKNKCILIEKFIRRFLIQRYVSKCFKSIICLQSFARMINAFRQYQTAIISVITIQAVLRKKLYNSRYLKTLRKIILIQCKTRQFLQRIKYLSILSQIIRLQAFGRKLNALYYYETCQFSILLIQTNTRKFLARNNYLLKISIIILLQSLCRAFLRRRAFIISRYASIEIQKRTRSYLIRKRFVNMKKASCRLQQCIRRYILNLRLYHRLVSLHLSGSERNAIGLTTYLNNNPEDRNILYHYHPARVYRSLMHSLIIARQHDSLRSLQFNSRDAIIQTDIYKRNSIHYLSMIPNKFTLKDVSVIVDSFKFVNKNNLATLDEDDNDDHEVNNSFNDVKEALHTSVGVGTLKQGFLKKKRGGMMWQKRWVVLTEDYIIYYKNQATMNNPKFAIPLAGCTIQRLNNSKEPIIEVSAPNMGEKKTFFGSSNKKTMMFLTESEQELQDWLLPLKAVAGVETLRPTPVHYVQTELRYFWLASIDRFGDNALHLFVKYASMRYHKLPSITPIDFLEVEPTLIKEEDEIYVLTWLVEFGADVLAKNLNGETPLHSAIYYRAPLYIISCLLSKGADYRTIKDNTNKSVMEIINSDPETQRKYGPLFQNYNAMFVNKPWIVPNVTNDRNITGIGKLKGYSYLSIFFENLRFVNTRPEGIFEDCCLLVSVYNSKRQLVESIKDLRMPGILKTSDDGLFWGNCWHMSTPLENIEEGSMVIIEFRPKGEPLQGQSNVPGTFSAHLFLETTTIDSSVFTMQFTATEDGSKGLVKATMNVELIISTKNRAISREMILASTS